MAKRTARSTERANQRAARDENSVINGAVAATEQEIADFVLDDDALALDGDTSLEEMGDDLEGEDDIRDAEADTDDEDDAADDGEEDEEDTADETVDGDDDTEEGDDDEAAIAAQDRQQSRGSIPPHRLREETARARAAEAALAERDQRIASLEGRVDTLTQIRGPAQPQPQPVVDNFPAEPPDPFVDYPGWQSWNAEHNRREIARGIREAAQQSMTERLNESFQAEATGPRSYEFHAAYDALMALPSTSPNDALKVANKIKRAADPSAALYEWWEDNGANEFRERIAVDLAERMGWQIPDEQPEPRQNGRANGRGEPQRQQQRVAQPQGGERRPVFRGPQRAATRSLNDSGGGVRQQIDPRAMDDSDAAVMDYALEP